MSQPAIESVRTPEEVIFRACYAPIDLARMLEKSESRSRIRRLPIPQLFYGLKELGENRIPELLPHLTQEQWTGVLDLDIWEKDEMSPSRFLDWQKQIIEAPDPVGRKLIRAAESALWEVVFKQYLQIFERVDDEFECEPPLDRESFETPDRQLLVVLPREPEMARIMRLLLLRLFGLESETTIMRLQSSRFRTVLEMEETAYESRKLRIEDLGFQDYYESLSIYTSLEPHAVLPRKDSDRPREVNSLPVLLPEVDETSSLLFQTFGQLAEPGQLLTLMEELAFVCNKILAADRVSPADPERVREAIRKCTSAINVGLEIWSGSDLSKATKGVEEHYLQSFFQIGYGRLLRLKAQAEAILESDIVIHPGTFEEAALERLMKPFPLRTILTEEKRIEQKFFEHAGEIDRLKLILHRLLSAP